MSVRYLSFDNEQVSYEWFVFLTAARHDGVEFHLNEGHRTMARQRHFRWLYEHVPGSPLAAFPSDDAPHIRTGRFWHACDFNGAENIRVYGERHGVTLVRTVRWPNGAVREEWHLECRDPRQLAAFAKRHAHKADPLAFMRPDERRWVREYVRLKKADKNIERRRVLRRVMTERRKAIYRAANSKKGGWTAVNRRKRWTALRRYT